MMIAGRMWIEPDGEGEPTLWRLASSFQVNPFAILRRCEIHGIGRAAVWDLIVRAVEREWPDPHIYIWNPRHRGIRFGYEDRGNDGWLWRCRFPIVEKNCRTQFRDTHAEALADALAHLASEHGGTS